MSCVDSTPGCVSLKCGLYASGVTLTRQTAPPGGPGRRFPWPRRTWGETGPREREAMLTWLVRAEHPPQLMLPLRLCRARGGLTLQWRP